MNHRPTSLNHRAMRLKTFVPILLLSTAVAAGCADLSVADPNRQTADTFWQTQQDALAGLTATYAGLPYQGTYGRYGAFNFDARSDEGESHSPNTSWAQYTKFIIPNKDIDINWVTWHDHYATIARANQVIDNVPGIQMDAALRSRIVGEALFLRALLYSNLVNLYGNVPLSLHAADPSTRTAQVPAATTWAQIETDLNTAIPSLPLTYSGGDLGRATKGAAQALLGKVELQQRKWTEAAAALNSVITSNVYSLLPRYADNFGLQRNNAESVFEVQMSNYDPANGLVGLNISKFCGPPGIGFNDCSPTAWYINQFTDTTASGARDPRAGETLFFPGDTTLKGRDLTNRGVTGVYWKKWANPTHVFQDFDEPIDYRVIRYADVLLMYAEAKNELNDQATAYTYVNMVRARAGVTPLKTGLDQAGMRAAILHERLVELGLEQTRWLDMKRQNIIATQAGVDSVKTLHDPEFNTFVLGKSELLPIPQSEVDLNPNVKQNPGW
jgi:hypothetical protein